jgi:hypothetical protein
MKGVLLPLPAAATLPVDHIAYLLGARMPWSSTNPITTESVIAWADEYAARKNARWKAIRERGFVLLTVEVVDALANILLGHSVIEAGSGGGFLAQHLTERGCNVKAVDICDPAHHGDGGFWMWKLDIEGDAVPHIPGHDYVLMCWPPFQHDFALHVALAMQPGQTLIHQGEDRGCTGTTAFFDEIEETHRWQQDLILTALLNEHHRQYENMHDQWSVWLRL